MCSRETPFTALQQGDINDLLRVSVPVQINRVIIKEARDFASHFRVSYDIFLSIMEAAKPVFSVHTHDGGCAYQAAEHRRFVGDSALHTSLFGRVPLLVGETAEVVLASATSTGFDSTIQCGHQVRWTYQPGSHRRKVTQDFSSAFFLRCVP